MANNASNYNGIVANRSMMGLNVRDRLMNKSTLSCLNNRSELGTGGCGVSDISQDLSAYVSREKPKMGGE